MKLLKIYFGFHLFDKEGILFGISKVDNEFIVTFVTPLNDFKQITNYKTSNNGIKFLGVLNSEESLLPNYSFSLDMFPILFIKSKEVINVKYFPDNKDNPETIIIFYNAYEINKSVLFEKNSKNAQASDIFYALEVSQPLAKLYNFQFKDPMKVKEKASNLYFLGNLLLNLTTFFKSIPMSAIALLFYKKIKKFIEITQLANKDSQSRLVYHRYCNFLFTSFIDICFGLVILNIIQSNFHSNFFAELLLSWTEWIAAEMIDLLNWLTGFPGGLKLNQPLAEFLGQFFIYHIQLWKDYLRLLYPLWSKILHVCLYAGVFGFTLQIALLRDLVSIMTLHIYCIYVYAARLYFLLFYALKSLFRLFLGRKWNILRNRVDTLDYELDQLFVGTLLFTIFLFLMPTVMLFYAVFCINRLLVLSVQGVLELLQRLVTEIPLYFILLHLISPGHLSDEGHISVVQGDPLCLKYELRPTSIFSLYNIANDSKFSISLPWKDLIWKIVNGQLIYLWIDAEKNKIH